MQFAYFSLKTTLVPREKNPKRSAFFFRRQKKRFCFNHNFLFPRARYLPHFTPFPSFSFLYSCLQLISFTPLIVSTYSLPLQVLPSPFAPLFLLLLLYSFFTFFTPYYPFALPYSFLSPTSGRCTHGGKSTPRACNFSVFLREFHGNPEVCAFLLPLSPFSFPFVISSFPSLLFSPVFPLPLFRTLQEAPLDCSAGTYALYLLWV